MDVKELKPHVTMFSAEFPFRGKHHEEIVVGGEVKLAVNNVFAPEGEGESMLVMADDGLGELQLIVPKKIYDLDAPGIDVKVGSKILAKGRLLVLEGVLDTNDRKRTKEYRVIVRELHALPVAE